MKQQPNPRSEINLQDKSGADVIYNVINIKVDIIDRWSIEHSTTVLCDSLSFTHTNTLIACEGSGFNTFK